MRWVESNIQHLKFMYFLKTKRAQQNQIVGRNLEIAAHRCSKTAQPCGILPAEFDQDFLLAFKL